VIELTAAGRLTPDEVQSALRPEFTIGAVSERVRELTYHDTFDAGLRSAGITYALERGTNPPAELPDDVRAAIGVRALLPLASVRIEERTCAVLDDLDKTVARVSLRSPTVLAKTPHGRDVALPARLVLEGVRGYETELERVRELLTPTFDLGSQERSLRDEAVAATGGTPEGISSKVSVELEPSMPADAAAAKVMRSLIAVMEANLPGVIADIDPEFLHDYRVSLRRSRAVLREFRDGFDAEPLATVRDELKWLQQATGEARDLDVHVLDFEELRGLVPAGSRASLEPLLKVLQTRRIAAHRAMVWELRGERAAAALRAWRTLLDGVPDDADGGGDGVGGGPSVGQLASQRIRKVYRTMVRMGERIDDSSPPEDYHDLRKKGKELRYLLELFGEPLHDPAVVKPMVKALKRLQDVLGRHQDREVQLTTISRLSEPVSALPGGAGALMVMGVLIERLDADAVAARAEFASVFADFASAEQQALVKRTFAT
jgi:CHAD domain-containing protein